jgi:hypothetical protein
MASAASLVDNVDDDVMLGGTPDVPDDDPPPGVAVDDGVVGPHDGPPVYGSPLPGLRLVLQPKTASAAISEAVTRDRLMPRCKSFDVNFLRICPPVWVAARIQGYF